MTMPTDTYTGPKVIRDGKVAVIYSPGRGAGWSTWNRAVPALLFDPVLVAAVEINDMDAVEARADKINEDGYHSAGGLKIAWLEVGTVFYISELDGHEEIVTDFVTA